jgi:hypothetical protein
MYYSLPPTFANRLLFGEVVDIIVDLKNNINRVVVDTSVYTGSTVPPIQDPYTFYIKNSVAESHGVLGHYCRFDLTNQSADKIELFALETEVMKSYP